MAALPGLMRSVSDPPTTRRPVEYDVPGDEDDPLRCPAIVVSGFKFDKTEPAEKLETRLTIYFQKRKHGGGDVCKAQLLDETSMRVSF